MNKASLIEKIAEKTGIEKREVTQVLDSFEAVVIERLKAGDEVTLTGFGTFIAKFRSARGGVNPQKPEERIQVPAVTVPKFRAGKTLKDALKSKVV
ncbi:HU family DNA-binding protein [Candidatus Kuenenbacteria bacterium]|nr:HU family DNA-binding protein [Candidatus Kuenenbacteria bacterium]